MTEGCEFGRHLHAGGVDLRIHDRIWACVRWLRTILSYAAQERDCGKKPGEVESHSGTLRTKEGNREEQTRPTWHQALAQNGVRNNCQ